MAISNGIQTITLDDILDYKTELEILNFYLEIYSLPAMINSPLRPDKSPSFSISFNDSGNIRFYDFGGVNQSGGLFDLLMDLYKLSFQEVLIKIYNEMINGNPLVKIDRTKNTQARAYIPKIEKLDVKVRKLRQHDIEFWGKGGITEEWLEFGGIHPISHIFITKDGREMIIPADRYAYVYVEFKDDKPTYKIYQPFSENYKWINKHDKSVWDLWRKLPLTGETLIITSSRKDALCIWANLNIPSTCLQAESLGFKDNVVDEIKGRFKNIYLLYDNDYKSAMNWGRLNGEKICSTFGFKQIEIPEIYESKDPFELRSNYGERIFKEIISELINE